MAETEREKAIREYREGKLHGCVQESKDCGYCPYRFTCKLIWGKTDG